MSLLCGEILTDSVEERGVGGGVVDERKNWGRQIIYLSWV